MFLLVSLSPVNAAGRRNTPIATPRARLVVTRCFEHNRRARGIRLGVDDNEGVRWFRKPAGDSLSVSMSGLKLGDRLLILGSADTALAAALASKVGLTGRACLLDESADRSTAAAAAVEQEGALVESFTAPMAALPFEPASFDVVVARNVFPALPAAARTAVAREVTRVVRAGGRCIVIDDVARSGWGGLIGSQPARDDAPGPMAVALLTDAGFRSVRTLAEREGVVFVEGVKAGAGAGQV